MQASLILLEFVTKSDLNFTVMHFFKEFSTEGFGSLICCQKLCSIKIKLNLVMHTILWQLQNGDFHMDRGFPEKCGVSTAYLH